MMGATFSSRKLYTKYVLFEEQEKSTEKKTWFDVTICCNICLVLMSSKKISLHLHLRPKGQSDIKFFVSMNEWYKWTAQALNGT